MNKGLLGWPTGGVVKDAPHDLDVLPVRDNLHCWLRANNIPNLNDGDSVALWRDDSGQGNDATQVTGANQPVFVKDVLRGYPAVRFVPTQYFNLSSFAVGFTEGTVFEVIKSFASNNTGHWTWGTAAVQDQYQAAAGIYEGWGSTTRKGPISPGVTDTQWNVYNVLSKAGEFTVRMNNSSVYTTATNAVAFTASPKIGASYAGTSFKGDIAEFVLYNRALTTQEITDTYNYLKAKWGTP